VAVSLLQAEICGATEERGRRPVALRIVHETFSIAVWNLFQGLHHRSKVPKRLRHNTSVVAGLRALDADVLILPEAWRFGCPDVRWSEELAHELGYELHEWISDRPSRPNEVCAWRIAVLTRIPAERLEDQVMPEYGKLGRRAFVRVRLETGATIAGTHLYGVHVLRRNPRNWISERTELRRAAADNDIVAGDLNMWGPVVAYDTPGMRRAIRSRTFPSSRPHSQIDHILVADRVEVIDSTVSDDLGSDHRAVRTTLRVKVTE
jgi:endonuclease/exonuclease/phosphatase family metal-dependent hydrolase